MTPQVYIPPMSNGTQKERLVESISMCTFPTETTGFVLMGKTKLTQMLHVNALTSFSERSSCDKADRSKAGCGKNMDCDPQKPFAPHGDARITTTHSAHTTQHDTSRQSFDLCPPQLLLCPKCSLRLEPRPNPKP